MKFIKAVWAGLSTNAKAVWSFVLFIGVALILSLFLKKPTEIPERPKKKYTKSKTVEDAYDICEVAFVGKPERREMQVYIESVLNRYNMSIEYDNILKLGNALVELRKQNKVGITEMRLLRYLNESPIKGLQLGQELGYAATLLEINRK